jgi:integrase
MRILDLHLWPSLGAIRLRDLAPEDLLTIRRRLTTEAAGRYRRHLKPKTVNHVLVLAKQIASFAVKLRKVGTNPFAGVGLLQVPEQPFDYWQAEERDRFLRFAKQLDPEFARLVLIACYTGLRKGELWALRRGQLDFKNRIILVSATYDHKLRRRLERTKDGSWGTVPMSDVVYEALKDQTLREGVAQVFPDVVMSDAAHRLTRLCLQTGTKVIRFHDLRHTFASCLAMAGVPIYDIQRLMRHKSLWMTQRYAHLSPAHLHSAINALCAPSLKTYRNDVREDVQGVQGEDLSAEKESGPRRT